MFRVAGTADSTWFWKSGQISIDQFNTVLEHVGKRITDFPRALDFGCGCGRIELHLEDVAKNVELHAVDIDSLAINWAVEHIPWARFSQNQGLPPLDFPDEYFDLVFNHSVFTHLDERYQDAWLVELERVTKPGGLLILSVSGGYPFSLFEKNCIDSGHDPQPFREIFRSRGHLFIPDDGMQNSPFPDFYHTTFHAPWYIFERWASIFDIKAYIVRGDLNYQDLLLLQRKDKRVGALPPAADFGYKVTSVKDDVSRLKLSLSECEQGRELWRSVANSSKMQLENVLNSRSWRMTAPLRGFMSMLRGEGVDTERNP